MNLDAIRAHRPDILRIAQQHKAENVRIFGSFVRAEAREGSDIDMLVHFLPGAGLFDVVDLDDKLTALLGRKVSVLSDRALREELAPYILSEAVPL